MFHKRMICLLAAAACMVGLCAGASAVEVESGSTYCFSGADFSPEEELKGICITDLPDASAGTVLLGSRVLRPGDILTAEQLAKMTFAPLDTTQDRTAQVTYLPIYENRVAPSTTVTISIKGKENKAPVAEDSAIETYKNLPNEGKLKVTEPEGENMTFTVIRQPKRGAVEIRDNGTFLYTPKKNKVGTDSFTYKVADAAGNVSREATVTVQILKPADGTQYTDTVGSSCRFAAEWMKNTGLFVGEKLGGSLCFNENKSVSRGEYLIMMVKSLGIPVDEALTYTGYTDEAPVWLKPYLAAALRAGVTAGLPSSETGVFGADEPITWGEAAVMLQNVLDLSVTTSSMDEMNQEEPAWAMAAVEAMSQNGITMEPTAVLTRGQVAELLYQVSKMTDDAPGLRLYQ